MAHRRHYPPRFDDWLAGLNLDQALKHLKRPAIQTIHVPRQFKMMPRLLLYPDGSILTESGAIVRPAKSRVSIPTP